MKRAFLLLSFWIAAPAGGAGFEAGVQHIVAFPIGESQYSGGELDVPLSRGWGATGEVWWSEHFSTQLAATFLNPAAILHPAVPPPDDVDLETLGIDTYSLTARWNFAPQARWSLVAGAGVAYVILGDLDDRFGEAFQIEFDAQSTFIAQAGVRWRFRPRVALDFGFSWMPLSAPLIVHRADDPRVVLPQTIDLDPATFSAGASWRF